MSLRFPIGEFQHEGKITDQLVETWIGQIASLPSEVRHAVQGLSAEQLDTPYRPEGWTVRQVVHHLADSHINSLIRFKWALTEDTPTIKPYYEERWAQLADYREVAVEDSIRFLEGLHHRWVVLLRALSRDDLARTFVHPDWGVTALDRCVGVYAWHGRHHVAHITRLAERMGW